MKVKAAVLRGTEPRFELADLELGEPRPDEILVRGVASGICHADLIAGANPRIPRPIVLGHEGAGVVERVGEAVRGLAPGDHVLLSFAACGQCELCVAGRPNYCRHGGRLRFGGSRLDGSTAWSEGGQPVHGHYFGQSSFATAFIASERNAVKIDPQLPLDVLAPLGCGIQTGAGSVLNILRPEVGSSLAVFGVGSVGLSALLAAVAVGCTTIIAVDTVRSRLELASQLGATHVLEDGAEIRRILPHGVNFAFDTTGSASVLRTAVESLDILGVAGFVAPVGTLELPVAALFEGRSLRGIEQGDSLPQLFLPRLIELWRQGRFPFDKLVTFFPFEEINAAGQASLHGEVVKPVLRL